MAIAEPTCYGNELAIDPSVAREFHSAIRAEGFLHLRRAAQLREREVQ
jgi:hypothetical protein